MFEALVLYKINAKNKIKNIKKLLPDNAGEIASALLNKKITYNY